MLGTSARLLRLLTVLQTRRFWSGADLAEHLDVTGRTLRRDVDRLRSLGYAIDATSGPGGGYQLGKGTAVPPLQLADDEAVVVAVALRAAADTFAGSGEIAVRVLAKLDQLLPERLRRRVGALQAVTVSVAGPAAALDADLLTLIASACRDSERLTLAYLDREKTATRRSVEPLRLAHVGNRRWYLIAWDVERADWRTFRVDRVQRIVAVGPRFAPREAPADLEKWVANAISHAPYPYRARIALNGAVDAMKKRVPPWCGVLEPFGSGRSMLSTGAGSLEGLVCQMLLTGVDFEIVEPRALVPQVRKLSQRLLRATRTNQEKTR